MRTPGGRRSGSAARRTTLIALANLIPIAGYLVGSVSVVEVLAVYALETLFVGGAVAARLLVVDPAASDRRAPTLVRFDRAWLPRPVRVTYWNVDQAVFAMLVYGGVTAFVLGSGAMFMGIALTVAGADPLSDLSLETIALTSLGLVLVHAREVGSVLVSDAARRVSATRVKARLVPRATQAHSIVVGLGMIVGIAAIAGSDAVLAIGLVAFVAIKTVTDLNRSDAVDQWESESEAADGQSDADVELSEDDLLAADSTAPPAYPRRVLAAVGCASLVPVVGYLAAGWTIPTLVVLYAAELSFVWIGLHLLVGAYYPEPSSKWVPAWAVRLLQFVCFTPFAAVGLAFTFGLPMGALYALGVAPPADQYPSLGAGFAVVAGASVLALVDGARVIDRPRVDAVTSALKSRSGTLARSLLPSIVIAVCLAAVDAPAAAVLPLVACRAVLEGLRHRWGRLEGERDASAEPVADASDSPAT